MESESTGEDSAMVENTTESGVAGTEPEHAAPTSDTERDARAMKVVERFAIYAGAGGLIPLPVVDLAAVGGIQFQMLRRLAQIYDVPFTRERARSVIASAAGSIVPLASAGGISSMVKSVPLVGTTISVITSPIFSGGATYLLGEVFIRHFASGGTLLEFDPAKYREFVSAHRGRSDAPSAPPAGSQSD
jgi:uncharacterized protein (DUF697 family)